MQVKIQAAKRKAFLATLAETGAVATTCRTMGLSRAMVYAWRKADSEFAEAWDASLDCAASSLEAEALRRAVDGVQRPVFQGGVLVGHVTEHSDRLLEVLLRAANPSKYGTSRLQVAATVEPPAMSDQERAHKLMAIIETAENRANAAGQANAPARDTNEDLA